MSFTRLGVALLSLVFAQASYASPVVTVTVGLPQVVIAPPPPVVVVKHRPACPGPNSVWVQGSWRRDAYGRQVWVEGHCEVRPVVVHHHHHHPPPPPPRRVIVHHH